MRENAEKVCVMEMVKNTQQRHNTMTTKARGSKNPPEEQRERERERESERERQNERNKEKKLTKALSKTEP
jgi:hypothetical protein